jgi:hypothetical protein
VSIGVLTSSGASTFFLESLGIRRRYEDPSIVVGGDVDVALLTTTPAAGGYKVPLGLLHRHFSSDLVSVVEKGGTRPVGA